MTIGEKIKRLRQERNITQETLAKHLSISCPAISKWERNETLLDINMIIPLASYFGVSTDEILGYDTVKNENKIQWYIDEHKKLIDALRIEEAHKLVIEAHKEFSNDFRISHLYMWKLVPNTDHSNNLLKHEEELIPICERILDECSIDYIRNGAISMLAKIYKAKGNTEAAIKMIERFPHWYGCVYESECERLYTPGSEEWWYWVNSNLFDLTYLAESKLMKIIWTNNKSFDSKVATTINCIEIIKNICDESGYPLGYFHIMSMYSMIANKCIHEKRLNDAVIYYDYYLQYAKLFDNFMASNKQIPNTNQKFKNNIIKKWGSSDHYNQVKRIIVYLENGDLYKELRQLDSYKTMIKKYQHYAKDID